MTTEAVAAGRSLSSPFYDDAIEALPHDFWVNAEREDISPFGTKSAPLHTRAYRS
jgi:hypothetical protein